MIVVRRTIHIKDGAEDKLVELLRAHAGPELPSPPHGQRIYTSGEASPWGLLIWETDFESLAEKEAFEKEWLATPGAGELMKEAVQLIEQRGTTTEFWTVEHVK